MCRQAGITRATTIEEAFEAAATFATQPLPARPAHRGASRPPGDGASSPPTRSRATASSSSRRCPTTSCAAIDEQLPPRWSRNNPIDLAGGETRDTIPEVLELVARHPEIDAIVYLGLGIQSNQARLMRRGRFYPDHGLERIVAYHERQDARFAQAAAEISDATGKPILTATELAVAAPDNPGPADGARDRAALLPDREPRGDRARPSRARHAIPARAWPCVTTDPDGAARPSVSSLSRACSRPSGSR